MKIHRYFLVVGAIVALPLIALAWTGAPGGTAPTQNVPGPAWLQPASPAPTQQNGVVYIREGRINSVTTTQDIYVGNGKSIRLDQANLGTFYFGNYGAGATGFTLGVLGDLTINGFGGSGLGKLNTYSICLANGTDCRTTWPSGGGGGDYVLKSGDTMSGQLTIATASTSGLNATGLTYGVYGKGIAYGVYGTGTQVGVNGIGQTGVNGIGVSYGLYGTGQTGVYGRGSSAGSTGVWGVGASAAASTGVYGTGTRYGVYGIGSGYSGVYGVGSGFGSHGVYGVGLADGVKGEGGTYGVEGRGPGTGVAGYGMSRGGEFYNTSAGSYVALALGVYGINSNTPLSISSSHTISPGFPAIDATGENGDTEVKLGGPTYAIGAIGMVTVTSTNNTTARFYNSVNGDLVTLADNGFGIYASGSNFGIYAVVGNKQNYAGKFDNNGSSKTVYLSGQNHAIEALGGNIEVNTFPTASTDPAIDVEGINANGSAIAVRSSAGVNPSLFLGSQEQADYPTSLATEGLQISYNNDVGDSYFNNIYTGGGVVNSFHFQSGGVDKVTIGKIGAGVQIGDMACGVTYEGVRFGATSGATCTNYTLMGDTGGNAYLNAATGKTVSIRVNNANIAYFDVAGAHNPIAAVWQSSDLRLKDHVTSYGYGLDKLMLLDPISFQFRVGNSKGIDPNTKHVGIGAQDLQKVMPEAVMMGNDGYLEVNTDPIFWAMVNSIKELKTENDGLKAKVDNLETRIEALEQKVK
jgi:hypothetical protein